MPIVEYTLLAALAAGAVASASRARRRAQRQATSERELAAFGDLGAALASAASLAEIVEAVQRFGAAALGADASLLLLAAERGGRALEVIRSASDAEEIVGRYRPGLLDAPSAPHALPHAQHVVFFASPRQLEAAFPQLPTELYAEHARWAALTLERQGEVLGTLVGAYRRPRRSDDVMRARLGQLAAVLASALERAITFHSYRQALTQALAAAAAGRVGTWVWELGSDRVYVDRACAQLIGAPPEIATSGAPMSRFLKRAHPEDRERVRQALESSRTEGTYEAEFRFETFTGECRWMVTRGRVERSAAGAPLRLTGVVVDTTAAREAEAQLRRAERERLESRALLDVMMSSAPLGLAYLSEDLRFVSMNDFMARLKGVTVQESIGKHIREVLGADEAAALDARLLAVLARREPMFATELTAPWPGASGPPRDWLVSYYPVGPIDAPPLGIGLVVVEITDRKRTEVRARALHAFIAALAEVRAFASFHEVVVERAQQATGAATVACYRASPDRGVLELAAGLGPHTVALEGDDLASRAFCTGAVEWRAEVAAVRIGTSGRGLGVLLFGFSGVVERSRVLDAHLRDVGLETARAYERVKLLEAERAAASRLRLLADASRLFVGLSDADELVHAAAALIGQHLGPDAMIAFVDEATGFVTPHAICVPDPEVAATFRRLLHERPMRLGEGLVGGVAARGEPLFFLRRDVEAAVAETRPEQLAAFQSFNLGAGVIVPLRDGGRIVGVIAAVREEAQPYTEEDRLLLEEIGNRLAQALASLEQRRALVRALDDAKAAKAREEQARWLAEGANRAKDEFLAMLGHELRNPLSPILTALQLMRLRGGDHFERERAIIERQVKHMVRLVDDLLDVSRITRGKVELKRRPVELAEIVASSLEIVSPLLEQRAHRVSTDVPQRGCVVNGDPERLTQIFCNLLTNAAKYTDPGGQISVRVRREAKEIVLSVRDTGIGIAPEMLPHIFSLFVQGERTLERSQGGLGLGLSIVHSLAQLHGGAVEARSEGPGHGSEFIVRFPVSEGEPAESAPRKHADAARSLADRRRILVVDDNEDAALALSEALAAAGHDVRVAADGPAALAEAAKHRPHVIFLDIGLPVMDGYEVARRLRTMSLAQRPTIVAITGYGQEADRRRAVEAGFDRHLVKPVELEQTLTIAASGVSPM